MNDTVDFDLQNFQSLIDNYESAIKDITSEIDDVLIEQNAITNNIREVLNENSRLNCELDRVYAERVNSDNELPCKESGLIENLKQQLKLVLCEKENAVKLWQNAAKTVDYLEAELKIYQENTDGLVPKSKLFQLKSCYEKKLNSLEENLSTTKRTLEETIKTTSRELRIREKQIGDSLKTQDGKFQIIKNLEDEILKLQQRANEGDKTNIKLEKISKRKSEQVEQLKMKACECRRKVEEALQVAEGALSEKDAALLRETEAKEEILRLSKAISEVVEASEQKVKDEVNKIKASYEEQLQRSSLELKMSQEENKMKNIELDGYIKKCSCLEKQMEMFQHSGQYLSDNNTSKLLMLEKNMEDTFQKLLISEKQNIKLRAEKESIKNDLDQMSTFYERDIETRVAEKAAMKKEITKLQLELEQSRRKVEEDQMTIKCLNERIAEMDENFRRKIEETNSSFQQTCKERVEVESIHKQLINDMQTQLTSQVEINKKWRTETKNITEKLEKRISELKSELCKIRMENKALMERLKGSNVKILEYKKFLELISKDVNRISHIALPSDKIEQDKN